MWDANLRPTPAKIPHRLSGFARENEVLSLLACDALLNQRVDQGRHLNFAAFIVLCLTNLKADGARRKINLAHSHAQQLS